MITPPEEVKQQLSILPEKPGVYRYFDKEGKIIYIGKAKNLKKRVLSYFNKEHDRGKTQALVANIRNIEWIVVENEEDALHLENSLIKEYQPRYNILLKDDKTYPWIIITKEEFPRILLTRNVDRNKARYFGPYANIGVARTMIRQLHDLYPLRTCNQPLLPEKIAQGRYKPCLQYHIKRCNAPCIAQETIANYQTHIEGCRQILQGETQQLIKQLRTTMKEYADRLQFEEAEKTKKTYLLIDKYRAKSAIVSSSIDNTDVFGYEENEGAAYVNYLYVRHGSIVQSCTLEYRKRIEEAPEEILSIAITELRQRFSSNAKEIITPFALEYNWDKATVHTPLRGDKKRLLDISTLNVKQYRIDKLKQSEKINPDQRMMRILTRAQKDLQLDSLPLHIECFDNSNIQGTHAVSSCVVFIKAKPAKKEYRHFTIKSVVGPDDFASMAEVLQRRYTRLVAEEKELPQLIIVDGGKGQLRIAYEILEALGLHKKIAIIGIAKRLEEIYFPDDTIPLYLDKNSETLRLIQQMRDEAHRFGITHHRKKRSKAQVVSELDAIKGIGEVTRQKILTRYGSVKRAKDAGYESWKEALGVSIATKLATHWVQK